MKRSTRKVAREGRCEGEKAVHALLHAWGEWLHHRDGLGFAPDSPIWRAQFPRGSFPSLPGLASFAQAVDWDRAMRAVHAAVLSQPDVYKRALLAEYASNKVVEGCGLAGMDQSDYGRSLQQAHRAIMAHFPDP